MVNTRRATSQTQKNWGRCRAHDKDSGHSQPNTGRGGSMFLLILKFLLKCNQEQKLTTHRLRPGVECCNCSRLEVQFAVVLRGSFLFTLLCCCEPCLIWGWKKCQQPPYAAWQNTTFFSWFTSKYLWKFHSSFSVKRKPAPHVKLFPETNVCNGIHATTCPRSCVCCSLARISPLRLEGKANPPATRDSRHVLQFPIHRGAIVHLFGP